MADLNKIVYNIAGPLGRTNDNVFLNQLKYNIDYYRAMLLRRDEERNSFLHDHFIQDLGVVKMISVDAAEDCNLKLNCSILRTIDKIPSPVRFKNKNLFHYVGAIDKKTVFMEVEDASIEYMTLSPYSGNKPMYFYRNGYIYVINVGNLKYINIQGIFEEPAQVASFSCDGVSCYDENTDYPIALDMVEIITKAILSGEAQLNVPDEANLKVPLNGSDRIKATS